MFTLRYFENCQLLEPASELKSEHASTARKRAQIIAAAGRTPVAVVRDEKIAYIQYPDGRAERPPASAPMSPAEDCVRGTGLTCFCSPCRAARRP